MLLDVVVSYGLNPQWEASTGGGEYSSACPSCGGNDRFRLQPNKPQRNCTGSFWCRQCQVSGDTLAFCMKFLGDTFPQACQRLGNETGIPIPTIRSLIRNIPECFVPLPLIHPPDVWITKATAFVEWAHKNLLGDPYAISYLESRGISFATAQQHRIGFNPSAFFRPKEAWGIEEEGHLWFPSGIVLPSYDHDDTVIRLKIRRDDYRPDDTVPKYVAISGSSSGYNLVGNYLKRTVIAVESELDAYTLHTIFHDRALIVATGSCTKNPDAVAHDIIGFVKNILVSYDNDEGGEKMWKKWSSLYKNAYKSPVTIGKDSGEAYMHGYDFEAWYEKSLLEKKKI